MPPLNELADDEVTIESSYLVLFVNCFRLLPDIVVLRLLAKISERLALKLSLLWIMVIFGGWSGILWASLTLWLLLALRTELTGEFFNVAIRFM